MMGLADPDDRAEIVQSRAEKHARDVAFVLRCSGAATVSFMLGQAVGLPHPVWAAMSGIIVSQERLGETRDATVSRLLGTLVGVAIAVTVGTLTTPLGIDIAAKVAMSVGFAAAVARLYPPLRVCMWTCPIVFLTGDPERSYLLVGVYRGTEVLLGGITGALLHVMAEAVIRRIFDHGRQ